MSAVDQGAPARSEDLSRFGTSPPGPAGSVQLAAERDADILALLMPLWRRKWIILLLATLAAAAAVFYVIKQDNRYTASARVIFEPERLRIIDLNNVVATSDGSLISLRNEMEVLRSEILLDRVIDALRLERVPEFNPVLRGEDGIGSNAVQRALARIDWPPVLATVLRQVQLLPPLQTARGPDAEAERLRQSILAQLMDDIRLQAIPNTQVVEIRYTSTNPALSAAIVNMMGEQHIILQTDRKRDDIARATELLGGRVRDLENRLAQADEAVQLAELELAMGAEHGSALISGQIETLTSALGEASLRRATAQDRYDRAVVTLEQGGDIYTLPEFRQSVAIEGYRLREVELLDQEAALTAVRATAGNPNLDRLQARLAEIRRSIRAEAARIVAALRGDLEAARVQEERLQAELQQIQQRGADQSRSEMRLARLQREAVAVRNMYDTFLTRMNETMEQAALQAPDARFLTRASRPEEPDTRHALLILLAATMIGAGLGAGLILMLERMNDTLRSSADVEEQTGLSVIAGIPKAFRRGKPQRMLADLLRNPHKPLAESIRNLRASILFSNIDQAPRVVMFASSLPGEGKTTTAMLTAVTSQQMERSAIIVDCDLRRGTLGRIFERRPEQPGLLSVLQGSASLDEAVYVEPETGLNILAPERVGQGFGNPADILASRRFQRLIAQLKARYDLVILDTPPVLAVSDPRVIAHCADAVVYLVRWNKTRSGAVLEGLRDLRSVNARLAGITLTLVDERQARKYLGSGYLYKQSYT